MSRPVSTRFSSKLRAGLVACWYVALAGCGDTEESAPSSPVAEAVASAVPNVQDFQCSPASVAGGDGPIQCHEGARVRVAGIVARDPSGACRPEQPCPAASAEASKSALADMLGYRVGESPDGQVLVYGETLFCRSHGIPEPGLTEASCTSLYYGDIACAMMATRTVERQPDFDPVDRLTACAERGGYNADPFTPADSIPETGRE